MYMLNSVGERTYFVCCSVNVSVCLVCCVLDCVCELSGETICNVFGCGYPQCPVVKCVRHRGDICLL